MTASQIQVDTCYQVNHINMGAGFVRRMGVLYHFWDKHRKEKGIINTDDLSDIVPLNDRQWLTLTQAR